MTTPEKPPTQIAGVQGIAPKPITMNEPPAVPVIDWHSLVGLPPFQMYAHEKLRDVQNGHDSEQHARRFLGLHGESQDTIDAYVAWHTAKGYWPLEDAFGKLKPCQ